MALNVVRMTDLDLRGKRVLIREDLNVPIKDGEVTSDARIKAAVPTLRKAPEQGAAVIVMSHLGRPKEGVFDPAASPEPGARRVSAELGRNVRLVRDWIDGVEAPPGATVLAENVRVLPGEKAHHDALT